MKAEDKLAVRIAPIREALDKALAEAAGERMAFVLMVVPAGRKGDHIVCSNIHETSVIVKFLRAAAMTVKTKWTEAQDYAEKMRLRGMDS